MLALRERGRPPPPDRLHPAPLGDHDELGRALDDGDALRRHAVNAPDEELLIEIEHPTRSLDTAALDARVRRAADAEGFATLYLGIVMTYIADVHRLYRILL